MATSRLAVFVRALAIGGALTLSLAGCGSSSSSVAPPGSPPATTAAASVTATPTQAVTPTPSPVTTLTPTPTPSATPVEPANLCRLSELQVTPGQTSAGAGHVGVPILFRNSGSRNCQLQGYPGVAGLNAAGQQAIQATRVAGVTAGLVTLSPGQVASALVLGSDVPTGNATGQCPSYTLLVTPPGETHSQQVAVTLPGCSLQVHPVILGTAGI